MAVKTRQINLLALARATGMPSAGSKSARNAGGGAGYVGPTTPQFEFKPDTTLAGTIAEGTTVATFRLSDPSAEYTLIQPATDDFALGPVVDGWQTLVVAEGKSLEQGSYTVSISAKTLGMVQLFEGLLISVGQEPFNYAVEKSTLKFDSDLMAGQEILNVQPIDSRLTITSITLNTTHSDIFTTEGPVIKRGTGAITRAGDYELELTYQFAGDGTMPATTRTEVITIEIAAVPLTGFTFTQVAGLQGDQVAGTRVATFKVLNPGATYELVSPSTSDLRIGTPLADGTQTLVVAPGITLPPGNHAVSIKVVSGPSTETYSNQMISLAAIPFEYTVQPKSATIDSDTEQGYLIAQFTPDDSRLTITGIAIGESFGGVFAIDGSKLLRGEALIDEAGTFEVPLTFSFSGDGAQPVTKRSSNFDAIITAVPITGWEFNATSGLEAPVAAGTVVARFKAANARSTYTLTGNASGNLALGSIVGGYQTLVVAPGKTLQEGNTVASVRVNAGPSEQSYTALTIPVAAEPFDYSVTPVTAAYNTELAEGGTIATLSANDPRLTITGVTLSNTYDGVYAVSGTNRIIRNRVDHPAGTNVIGMTVSFSGDGASPATTRSHSIAATHTRVPIQGYSFTPVAVQAPASAGTTVGEVKITNVNKSFQMISSTNTSLAASKTPGQDQWLVKVASGKTLVAGDYTFTIRAWAGPVSEDFTHTITVSEEAFDYTINFSSISFNSDVAAGTTLGTFTAADPRLTVAAVSLTDNYSNRFAVSGNSVTRGTGTLNTTTSYTLTVTCSITGDNASEVTTRQVSVPVTIVPVAIAGWTFTPEEGLQGTLPSDTLVARFRATNAGAAYTLVSSTDDAFEIGAPLGGFQRLMVASGKSVAPGTYTATIRVTAGPSAETYSSLTITVAEVPFNYAVTPTSLSFNSDVTAGTTLATITPSSDARLSVTAVALTNNYGNIFAVSGNRITRGTGALNTTTSYTVGTTITYSGDGASPATTRSGSIAVTINAVAISGWEFNPVTGLQGNQAAGTVVAQFKAANAGATYTVVSSTGSNLALGTASGGYQRLVVAAGKTLSPGTYSASIKVDAGPSTQTYTNLSVTVAIVPYTYTVTPTTISFNSDVTAGTTLGTFTPTDTRLTVTGITLANNYGNIFAVTGNRITRGTGALNTTTSYTLAPTFTFSGDSASPATTRTGSVSASITAVAITGYNFAATTGLRAPVAAGTVVGTFKVDNAGAAYALVSSTGSNLALGSISNGRQTIVVATGKTLAAGNYTATVRATAGPSTQEFTTTNMTVAAAYVTTVTALYDSFEVNVGASTLVNRFTPTGAGMTLTNLSVTAPTGAGFTVNGTDIQRGSNALTPGNYELTISYRLTTPESTSIGPFTATFPFTGYDNSGGGGGAPPPLS